MEAEKSAKVSWWKRFKRKATDAVPVRQEETIMLDHEYDGIRELDNHLPPWWKWLFYVTIVWSVGYLLVYHVFDWLPLMHEEYDIAVEAAAEAREELLAEAGGEVIDESTVVFSDNAAHLTNGERIYQTQCATCHGVAGQGMIGPNLTDNYWIHGNDMAAIFSTVKYGVPAKGMIAWQNLLTPADMRDVSSYVVTLHGTDPPNPKAPEGELFEVVDEEPAQEAPADSAQMVMN